MYGEVRVGDSFYDFRNVHPAGATSQDKNLTPPCHEIPKEDGSHLTKTVLLVSEVLVKSVMLK